MANASNILVINDEAHHAWRKNPENKGKLTKEEKEAEEADESVASEEEENAPEEAVQDELERALRNRRFRRNDTDEE